MKDCIAPLVARHASDAAFYWSQLDQSPASFRLSPARYAQFNARLEAHLEGLVVAGEQGLLPAVAALDRWKKAGEAFVCTWLVGQFGDAALRQRLESHLLRQPDVLVRGAASAVARLATDAAAALIALWSPSGSDPALQVIALRAVALLGAARSVSMLARPPAEVLTDTHPPLRAAACRVLKGLDPQISNDLLLAALRDDDLAVRAEAAIALTAMPDAGEAAETLWKCVADQVLVHGKATGWYRMQAARRLNRWTRYLAWLAPIGHSDVPTLLALLPKRIGLGFVLHHGDMAHLPFVLAAMDDDETSRYAGWVWQTLSGVDLNAAGLSLSEDQAGLHIGELTDAHLDADSGLPRPHAEAVRGYSLSAWPGCRTLLGRELSPVFAIQVMAEQAQAVRAVAAQYLEMMDPAGDPGLRAPAPVQAARLMAWRRKVSL